jgi:hypothetical protein
VIFFVLLFFSSYILTVCCITDMNINDIHTQTRHSEGFVKGAKPFLSIWCQN